MTRKSLLSDESHRWHEYKRCKWRLAICTIRSNGGIERALLQYRHPKLAQNYCFRFVHIQYVKVSRTMGDSKAERAESRSELTRVMLREEPLRILSSL